MAQPLPNPAARVKRRHHIRPKTPGGQRRDLRFFAHAPAAFWLASGCLAAANKAFTGAVRML
jgi:hypothetical protein